ncbi:MAG: GAF domain-containing protein, partial [Chloroflexi bacterium]|nr:GAF domain-containing protein [Chloroflexota bacterium]
MNELIGQLFSIIITPPGNLVYHLVLAFSLLATLQAVLGRPVPASSGVRNRTLIGLGLLLAGQVILFICSGLAWQGVIDSRLLLPPLDRLIIFWSLLWIVWMWAFPESNRWADVAAGLLSLVAVILFVYTITLWGASQATSAFNASTADWAWSILSSLVVIAGMFFLLITRPRGWETGFSFLTINLIGLVAHQILSSPNDNFSGAIRLALLCSFPLLPSLANRLRPAHPALEAGPESETPAAKQAYATDSLVVDAWLNLARQNQPEEIGRALNRAIAQTILADMCFLVSRPTAEGEVIFQVGYDLIRQESIPGFSLPQSRIPLLSSAVQHGNPLRLNPERTPSLELNILTEALNVTETGSLMVIPLAANEMNLGGILLLSPYSKRVWSASDQNYLTSLSDQIMQVFRHDAAPAPDGAEADGQWAQLRELEQRNQDLLSELDQMRD